MKVSFFGYSINQGVNPDDSTIYSGVPLFDLPDGTHADKHWFIENGWLPVYSKDGFNVDGFEKPI